MRDCQASTQRTLRSERTRLAGRGFAAAFAAALTTAALLAAPAGPARASECAARLSDCQSECAEACGADERCLARCDASLCAEARALCAEAGEDAAEEAAPRGEVLSSGGAEALSPRVQSAIAPAASASLSPHILFLPGNTAEPSAQYYGYLIIGEGVSRERKNAVAEAIACRLKALPNVEAAAAIERLGLVSLPALREAGATRVSPAEVLESYDFDRAGRWLRAAAFAANTSFDSDDALVFVASARPRARQMDSVVMPGPGAGGDPVIADASALNAEFAAAWAGSVIDGMERGQVRSRQELQIVMEANSWMTWVAAPVASLFRISPAQAAEAPPACP